jgi:hypothetical protein
MPAIVAALIPLLVELPGLIKDVQEIIAIMRTPELPAAERESRLDAISARLDQRVAAIEAMRPPERRTD